MNDKDSENQFAEFVALHKERTGKPPSSSDLRKLIELVHQRKNPLLGIQRIHVFMPTFITVSLIGLLLWLFTAVIGEKGATEGLKEMSAFFNTIPAGAWTLLQIMFGFWFAGRVGAELIERWKKSNDK